MNICAKKILLTGASGGIGQAIARQLADRGAELILVGRSLPSLSALGQQLAANGAAHPVVIEADICAPAGRETLRRALAQLSTPLDVLINCAGLNLFGFLADNTPEDIEQLITTNVSATILVTHLALPFLHPEQGRIITIGSSFGALGYPGFAAYCASKFALRGFTQALRRELSDRPLQIAYLAPRATNTALNSAPVRAMNQALGNKQDEPEQVAQQLVRMLAAKRMRDRNMGWPERFFIALNQIFPAIIDRALGQQLPTIRRYASCTNQPLANAKPLSASEPVQPVAPCRAHH